MTESGFDMSAVLVRIAQTQRMAALRYGRNKDAILNAMKANGILEIFASYSGSGDSGCVERVEARALMEGKAIDLDKIFVDVVTATSRFERGKWLDAEETKTASLRQAVLDFVYDWLEAKHPGWENNDGADGDLLFDLEQAKVTVTHHSHYMETDTTEDEL